MAKSIVAIFTACAISIPILTAQAQPPEKVPHIGFFSTASAGAQKERLAAFRQGLQEAGYVLGKDIVIEQRYAAGRRDLRAKLAAELVDLHPDVIVAQGAAATVVKKATTAIPLVVIQSDPVGTGLVESLAHPGGNVTGLASQPASMVAKRLQLLKEALPSISRVAVLTSTASTSHRDQMNVLRATAQLLGVTLIAATVRGPKDFDRAFSAIQSAKPDALIVLAASLFRTRRTKIVEFVTKIRLPAVYPSRSLKWGGLMSYGANIPDLFRRAAHYVDKILRGKKPADLPVELPTKFDFVVNLRTARKLGVTFPRSILLRADRIIE